MRQRTTQDVAKGTDKREGPKEAADKGSQLKSEVIPNVKEHQLSYKNNDIQQY